MPLVSGQDGDGGSGGGGQEMPSYYDKVKIAHAALGSVVWVIFFPLGAILVRLLKSPYAVRIHYLNQLFAFTIFVAVVGMGIWMARTTDQVRMLLSPDPRRVQD